MKVDVEALEKLLRMHAEKKTTAGEHDCPCRNDSYTYTEGMTDGMILTCKSILKGFFTVEKDPAQLELDLQPPNCS